MARLARQAKERPQYAIASVDHALRLAAILQLEGSLTVSAAAQRLGVAVSTAHRVLAMLVYRDFAVRQGGQYGVGPVLAKSRVSPVLNGRLRQAAEEPMVTLMGVFNETVTLAIRDRLAAQFLAEVECNRMLRVGHRTGMVFPAHKTSGGLALLAELTDDEVADLYTSSGEVSPDGEPPDLDDVLARVRSVRDQGFALNRGLSERGIFALGIAIRDGVGPRTAIAALSIALPDSRFEPAMLRPMVATLRACCDEIGQRYSAAGE